ncbi:MAG: DNA topoisomerase IB [Gemmatimonadaceae bacterium]
MKWIIRQGGKRRGFRYATEDGRAVRDTRQLARIDALRVPPGWSDVHVAVGARNAIQAWGLDVKGRKQYRYHQAAVEEGQLRKYHRVRRLARDLPTIRAAAYADFRRRGFTKRRIAAAVLRLIGNSFFRVGSEEYAKENKSFGATTLRKDHVTLHGDRLVFEFRGKSGVAHRHAVSDRQLAALVRSLRRSPGRRLFRYQTAEGAWRDLSADDVNAYIRELTSARYSTKDLRTWGGTLRAATVLAEVGAAKSATDARKNVMLAMRLVAAELGNTPAITRASYVHPIVIARYLDAGETIRIPSAAERDKLRRSGRTGEERALIAFLNLHFPERRKRKRPDAPADAAR